jgi:hypothetical protein
MNTIYFNSFYYYFIIYYKLGRNPQPTESQAKAVQKLASKLYTRAPKHNGKSKDHEEENEDIVEFELMDAPRVILFDGKVHKRSK